MAVLTSDYQYLGRSAKIAPQSGSYGYYILLYGKSVPDALTGYHAVSIRQVLACTVDSSFYQFGTTYSGTINGTTVFSGKNEPSAAWELGSFTAGSVTYKKGTVIDEGTLDVDCTDGAAHNVSLYCTWKFTVTNSAGYLPANGAAGTVSVTATLSAIPRASAVTASDAYIGAASTIIINKTNSAYTHTLSYRMAGQSAYTEIVAKTAATQYGWTVPESAYELIPNSREIAITMLCETFNGSVSMGTSSYTMTATARESLCLPEVTATAEDINSVTLALTGNASRIVRGFSSVHILTSASAKNGASVASVRAVCGTQSASGEDVTINNADGDNVTVTVTDSRGFSASYTVPGLTLVDYVALTLNPEVQRESPGSDVVSLSVSGNCFSGSFGAVDNALTVKARYKLLDGEYGEYTELTPYVSGTTYSASGELAGVLYSAAYDVEVIAYDAVYTEGKSTVYRIKKGIPVFDWGETDFRFNVPVAIPSEYPVILKGAGETDSAMNAEIYGYALSPEDGYCKFIYSPAVSHSTFGAYPVLIESFKTTSGGDVYLWLKATTVMTLPYVKEYGANYQSTIGWIGWYQMDGSGTASSGITQIVSYTSSGTATSYSFAPGNYSFLLLGLTPASVGNPVCVSVPSAQASASLVFQVADEDAWSLWALTSSGITRTEGTGYIRYIYGVKL